MSNWLNHFSVVGHLGKFGQKISDPLAMMPGGLGDKWSHLTSDILPAKVNEVGSHIMKPFEYVDKTINPVRKIPIVNRIGDIVANKPGDVGALVAGAYFGGGALMGGQSAGGAGSGAGAGGVEGGSGFVFNPAVDSQLASSQLGLTAADTAPGLVSAGGGADVAGLAQLDSDAVVAEGAEPGLTTSYGSSAMPEASSTPSSFQMGQQQQKSHRPDVTPSAVQFGDTTLQERLNALQLPEDGIVASSRALKTPVPAHDDSMRALAVMGASGRDKVSENGVHIGSIRALDKQIAQLEAVARKKGIKV